MTSKTDPTRLIYYIAILFFSLFAIISVYGLAISSLTSPAAWSMACFFVGALILLLFWDEKNMFPTLQKKSFPPVIVAWLSAVLGVAFLVSFLITMDLVHLSGAILFGVITVVSSFFTTKVKKPSKKKARKKRFIRY